MAYEGGGKISSECTEFELKSSKVHLKFVQLFMPSGGGCVNCQATLVPVWPSPPASEIQCDSVGTSSWDCWHEMLTPDSQSQGQPQKAIMGGL